MELSNLKLANLQASPCGCFPWGTVASKAAQRKLKGPTCAAWGSGLWAQFALRGQERCASRTNNDVWCLIHQKTSLFPRSYSHNKLGRSCLMVESWSWSFLIGSFASLQGATVECRVWMRNWAQSRSCRRSHELDQCPSRFGDQHAPLGFKLL